MTLAPNQILASVMTSKVKQADKGLTLENAVLQLIVRPDFGGQIDKLLDRQTKYEWLWHPKDYDSSQKRSLTVGASFDEHWTGGWDEVFPNDAAGLFQKRNLVDHGELWSQAWQVVETSELGVKLKYQCQTIPVIVEKTIRLHQTQPEAQIEYQFQNQSDETIPFLFKQHAAVVIDAGDEILLPDCLIEPVDLGFSKIIGRHEKTRFPKAFAADGREIELQLIPPSSSQLQEFYYCSNLAIGQCGIRSRRSQSSLVMKFDKSDFPYVWVF